MDESLQTLQAKFIFFLFLLTVEAILAPYHKNRIITPTKCLLIDILWVLKSDTN